MTTHATDLMLTGATGFLGHYLLAELLRQTRVRVRVLVRDEEADAATRLHRLLSEIGINLQSFVDCDRVAFIRGHLPDALDVASLDGVQTVLHAAGHTSFMSSADGEPRRTNVDGTAALLTACADRGVGHFVYVSTAFVCGSRTGRIAEKFSETPPPFCNDYERSKWEAERLVIRWASRRRVATISRPSILFGDSATGRFTSTSGVYLIARATEALARAAPTNGVIDRHAIPLRIKGRPGATCNLVPVDHAARRIVAIVADRAAHGRVHHITNPHPPTHADIKSWLEEHFAVGGGRFCDEPWPLQNPNHYEKLFYGLGDVVKDYFRDGLLFETRTTQRDDETTRPLIQRRDFLQSLRYARRTNWGRSRNTAPTQRRPSAASRDVDPAWYFEHHLVDTIPRSCIARIRQLSAVVAYTIDPPGRTWICTFQGGELRRVAYNIEPDNAEFGFRIARPAFSELVSGLRSPQQVFFDGHADITGRIERALRLVPIMAEYIAEFPAPANGQWR